jgi:uncharacterized protein (UPF0335 family)
MNDLTCSEISKIGACVSLVAMMQESQSSTMTVKELKGLIDLIKLTDEASDTIEEKLKVMFKEAKEKGL